MGACSSCLGRENEPTDENENARLLSDDRNSLNYGGLNDQNSLFPQADPQDVQRENEALQKVVAQTSSHLVDIFSLPPQNNQQLLTTTYAGQDARLTRYNGVLSRLSDRSDSAVTTKEASQGRHADWSSDDEDDENDDAEKIAVVKPTGRLQGGFADFEGKVGRA